MSGIELGLPLMSLLKYKKNFACWIQTLATCIRVQDFATGPSELDDND